jgi:glycine hydroxymethyltransferase
MKLKVADPQIYACIKKELVRQNQTLEMIASENFTSLSVMEAQGSVLTNKYAEGYPGKRYYGGCINVDEAERLAISRCQELFGGEHVNVQPHSGTQANMAVLFACLKPQDTMLAMGLASGGHLSHGHPLNFSGMFFKIVSYGLNRQTERLDYDEIQELALKNKPKLILAGASAYPRAIDFKRFREIADSVGAVLFVDMAHIAGLVAAGCHENPVPYADFVSSTTHKTLRGPRGGFIICRRDHSRRLDMNLFPGIQGGPLMHVIAAKAVAFKEAQSASFKRYQKQIVLNAKALADELTNLSFRIVTGGTDNHLILVDLHSKDITGKDAQDILENAGITVNKNLIPFDDKPPALTSGIRLGTSALSARGMKEPQMKQIANFINECLLSRNDAKKIDNIKKEVNKLTKKFPLYQDNL